MFHVGGALVELGVGDPRVERCGHFGNAGSRSGPRRARGRPGAHPHDISGHGRLQLGGVPGDAQLLFEATTLGEHAEVQHGTHAVGELNDHEGVVEDVGHLSVVALLEVVDVLGSTRQDPHRSGAGDQVHEVEEVTALLHQGASGVAVEAVPVTDLGQEGEPVLADRDHPGGAADPAAHLFDHHRGSRHVAVLQAHPGERIALLGQVAHPQGVLHGRAEGLLDQHVLVGGENVLQQRGVGVVGRREDDHVDRRVVQQVVVSAVHRDAIALPGATGGCIQAGRRPVQAGVHRIGHGHDLGTIEVADVEDVLAAHHPGADDPVADAPVHAPVR